MYNLLKLLCLSQLVDNYCMFQMKKGFSRNCEIYGPCIWLRILVFGRGTHFQFLFLPSKAFQIPSTMRLRGRNWDGQATVYVNPHKTSQDRHWFGTFMKRRRWGELGKPRKRSVQSEVKEAGFTQAQLKQTGMSQIC